MTVATLTEHYRGCLLVEVGDKVKVHPKGDARTTLFLAASREDAIAMIDAMLDGPRAA